MQKRLSAASTILIASTVRILGLASSRYLVPWKVAAAGRSALPLLYICSSVLTDCRKATRTVMLSPEPRANASVANLHHPKQEWLITMSQTMQGRAQVTWGISWPQSICLKEDLLQHPKAIEP